MRLLLRLLLLLFLERPAFLVNRILEPVFFLGGNIWLAPNKIAAGPALVKALDNAVYKAPPFIIGTGEDGRIIC